MLEELLNPAYEYCNQMDNMRKENQEGKEWEGKIKIKIKIFSSICDLCLLQEVVHKQSCMHSWWQKQVEKKKKKKTHNSFWKKTPNTLESDISLFTNILKSIELSTGSASLKTTLCVYTGYILHQRLFKKLRYNAGITDWLRVYLP